MGHTIATIFLPRSYCQTYSGYPRMGFCLSTGQCAGTSSTRQRRFPGAKGARLHSTNTVAAEITESDPVDCWIWRVLLEKVCLSRIANVNELEARLIDDWTLVDQSTVEAAIGQWRHRLSACVFGDGHTLSIKFQPL